MDKNTDWQEVPGSYPIRVCKHAVVVWRAEGNVWIETTSMGLRFTLYDIERALDLIDLIDARRRATEPWQRPPVGSWVQWGGGWARVVTDIDKNGMYVVDLDGTLQSIYPVRGEPRAERP